MTLPTNPVVLVGVGEMGGVFAKALLRAGHTVVPVTRERSIPDTAELVHDPELVLVTVGEDDLDSVLHEMPAAWRSSVGLIQNELLPRDWNRHAISDPTIAVVWFEKKPGIDTKAIIPTPVAGPGAPLLVTALEAIGVAATITSSEQIVDELVAKNLYILVANIAGLETGGTVAELWDGHRDLATAVGDEVLAIQDYLVGSPVDHEAAYHKMIEAFEGDPDHGTTGRSAPKRLARALAHAADADIDVPTLERIARAHDVTV